MVSVNDILDFLVARSFAPSTMGAQLDRLKYGINIPPDPFRQKNEVEDQLLAKAALLRCIDEFTAREEFNVPPNNVYKTLAKLKGSSPKAQPQGAIALSILRAYHERVTCSRGQSEERGLVAVYQYIASIAPSVVPPPPKDEPDLIQAFRTGSAKRARHFACEAYADALLALQQHVRVFNKKEQKK